MADDGQAPSGQQQSDAAAPAASSQQPAAEFHYETWLGEQPTHIQAGLEARTAGLLSALESERQQRKEFSKQLRELSSKAEKGSEAEKQLGEMSSRLEQAEQRAAFYEEAGRPEIGCTNIKAAYLIASADGLFSKRGDPDWPAIKQAAPELFGRKLPPGNAGAGAGAPPPATTSMNDLIRRAAGRQ